jgi:hypothetical protein
MTDNHDPMSMWSDDWNKADQEYVRCNGRVKFTNRQATHAVRHFHEIVDLNRSGEVPYMLGIMGGCFAHACDWTEELVAELEADTKAQDELFLVWAKMIGAYFQALDAGVFDHPEAHLS